MDTQDIKITPRTGSTTGLPEIFFQGSGTTASGITMSVHGSGDIVYDGHQGELLRLSSNLQSGTIFSVKDISGLDQISLDASGTINLNGSYGTTWFGSSGTYGTINLDANTNNYAIISGDTNPITQFSRDGNTYIQIIAGDAAATTSRQAQLYVTGGTAGNSKVLLGDTDDIDSCIFNYAHNTNDLKLSVNGTTYFRWESEGTYFLKVAASTPSADSTGCYLWSKAVSDPFDPSSPPIAELLVKDGAGNETQLSSHAQDAPEWLYDWDTDQMSPRIVKEQNSYVGIIRYTNLTRQSRLTERLIMSRSMPISVQDKTVMYEETFEEHNERTGNNEQKIDWDADQLRMKAERDAEIAEWELQDEDESSGQRPIEYIVRPKPAWLLNSEANA